MSVEQIADLIKDYDGWPEPGVVFKDITPLLMDPRLYREACTEMSKPFQDVNKVAGLEARGFPFGIHVALLRAAGFVMIRKHGKLPGATLAKAIKTEYSDDMLEIKKDNINPGDEVIIVDDVLATGGTVEVAHELLTLLGAKVVGATFLMELPALGGRERLANTGMQIESVLRFE